MYAEDATAYEGDTTPTAVVYLNKVHTEDVTLNYSLSTGSGDTATAGSDFTAQTGSVTILAGYTSATITLPLLTDSAIESAETFSLTLTGTSAGTLVRDVATITIEDSNTTITSTGELTALSDAMVIKVAADVNTTLQDAMTHLPQIRVRLGALLLQS